MKRNRKITAISMQEENCNEEAMNKMSYVTKEKSMYYRLQLYLTSVGASVHGTDEKHHSNSTGSSGSSIKFARCALAARLGSRPHLGKNSKST